MSWLETVTFTGGFLASLTAANVNDVPLRSMDTCHKYLDMQEERYNLPRRKNPNQLTVTFKKDGYDYSVIRTCLESK